MTTITALLTCFNRKQKTLMALRRLYKSKDESEKAFSLNIILTDDGSTDGTGNAVREQFPDVNVLDGSGDLFWAEGMRMAWLEAQKQKCDAFLLLNDDTEIYDHVFEELFAMHNYCLKKYGQSGIYVGATENKNTKQLTYSGSLITNKWLYLMRRLAPNGHYQKVDVANANIMMVPQTVVEKIGILTEGYAHGKADYDYSLMASRKGIPVLISSRYCGHCENDHSNSYIGFAEKTVEERRKMINHPTQLDIRSNLKFMRKFFPWRAPFVQFFAWFKIYFPKTYLKYFLRKKAGL